MNTTEDDKINQSLLEGEIILNHIKNVEEIINQKDDYGNNIIDITYNNGKALLLSAMKGFYKIVELLLQWKGSVLFEKDAAVYKGEYQLTLAGTHRFNSLIVTCKEMVNDPKKMDINSMFFMYY